MSHVNLEKLNKFRAAEGKAPITAWKKSRHEPMLAEYESRAKAFALIMDPEFMRPANEELGREIRNTRELWRASGANMTKKDFALGLMTELGGASIHDLVTKMGITDTAARSLVGDIRRMSGVDVQLVDGYYVATLIEDEEENEDGEE